jgi:hypothetical protein
MADVVLKHRPVLLGLIALGVLIGLALTEAWVRAARWMPPSQIVRGECLHSVDGVPVWGCESDSDDVRRHNRACVETHPERTRVLFLGSSITYGSDLTAAETFTTALEERLNQSQPTPGFCVLNFAQPGFHFDQKYAVALTEVARYQPALIMWESWEDWQEYRIIGDAAYAISDYQLRPDGFVGIAGVPAANRLLFLHSRLYEHLALRYGERASDGLPERESMLAFLNDRFIKVPRLARSSRAKLAQYRAPHLERPFAETVDSPSASDVAFFEFADSHDIPSYWLARELIDYDYLEVRLDPCCHYNARGAALWYR